MTKLECKPRNDRLPADHAPDYARERVVPSPFVAQGVRDALRDAYAAPGGRAPAELLSLLKRLH